MTSHRRQNNPSFSFNSSNLCFIVNFNEDFNTIIGQVIFYNLGPFDKTEVAAEEIFTAANIKKFVNVFKPVTVKMIYTFVFVGDIFIDYCESWTVDYIYYI